MIEMFYEKQKKFFNRKWQKGGRKTFFTVNEKKRASRSRNFCIFYPEVVTKVS